MEAAFEFVTAKDLRFDDKTVIITDNIVGKLYGPMFAYPQIWFSAGEKNKTRATKERIEDELLSLNYGSDALIVALGGGVVSDLAGFVAATFCRGVRFMIIPTTLMGMVDASLGGKTGVNTQHGKNLIGAYHNAEKIFIDLSFLSTLSALDLRNGIAEIIKYAVILDASLLDMTVVDEALVRRCLQLKQEIVALDPYDQDARRVLNFGHTVGHAIEAALQYEISHGEAVALGIAWESYISMQKLQLSPQEFDRIIQVLLRFGFNLQLDVPKEKLLQAIRHDKKVGKCVLIQTIGQPVICPIHESDIRQAYEYFSHQTHCQPTRPT